MSATTTETLSECACGCGELVTGKYKRGHWARAAKNGRGLLPGPDATDEELGEWVDVPDMDDAPEPPADDAADGPEGEPETRRETIPPRLGSRGAGKPSRAAQGRAGAPKRVTAATERDINAKIRMFTFPLAKVAKNRDPWCGGVFEQQEPDIAAALTAIVCQSPDLVNFFTGAGGRYMVYFELFMACLPVGVAVYGHHWSPKRPPEDGTLPPQFDARQYAA